MVWAVYRRHSRRKYEPSFDYPKGYDWTPLDSISKDVHWSIRVRSNWAYSGQTLNPDDFPTYMKFRTPEKVVQDIYSDQASFLVVSQRVKDKIEELEPGVHQFIPRQLLQKDGTEPWGPYFTFHIRSLIFSIDVEKSPRYEWTPLTTDGTHSTFSCREANPRPQFQTVNGQLFGAVHRAEVIGSRHIWREYLDFKTLPNKGDFLLGNDGPEYIGPSATPLEDRINYVVGLRKVSCLHV